MSKPEKLIPLHGGYRRSKGTASTYPEIAANGVLAVACSLLDRQIATLERNFVEEGGFTERLFRMRSQRRARG